MRTLLLLLMCTLLAACGGDKQSTSTPASWSPGASLVYAYPYDGQARIAPTAPVVLQFSTSVHFAGADPLDLQSAFSLKVAGGSAIPFTVATTNEGRGVVLTPSQPLAENTAYEVTWSNLAAPDGLIPVRTLTFHTRAAVRGATSAISSNASFQVERALPVQGNFPFMDFSTLRLQLTQPLDLSSLEYGVGLRLEDAGGNLVPARVLVSGPLLSIDPKADLDAGQTYHLKLTSALKSVTGAALVPGDYADLPLTPLASGPRATMALEVPDSGGTIKSPLTGQDINAVPIQSRLLGNDSKSQQAGNMYAELAFVPRFPTITPLTMRRGNMLSGSSVEVKITGEVPAGLDTDSISVKVVSDANGYMLPNPYSNALDAPRLVYLTMDAAMSALNAPSNGAFTQNLLHIEVVGTAIVKNGKLIMDAVGVVELDVLGLDQAAGVLSFHLEGYQDQVAAPPQPADTTPPTLQSWAPGDEAKRARPGDPVILNFTEAIDPDSLTSASIKLLKGGAEQPIRWRADGAAVVVRPLQPLTHGIEYTVVFSSAVTDLAGNGVADGSHQRKFTLPTLYAPGSRSPAVLATYPGYPCVTTGRDAAAGVQGRCAGGKAGDDVLPLPTLPTDRSILVQFSQSMNAASIQLGASCNSGSFRVETWDASNNCQVVPGRLEVSAQSLRFTPDAPWTNGKLYRYVLGSNGNSQSATATCDGSDAICGSNGLPLQTQLLAQSAAAAPAATGGGPDMEIWFRGGPALATVAQRLRGLPALDTDANFVHDSNEEGPADIAGDSPDVGVVAPNAARTTVTATSGLVQDANIGCAPGPKCPQNEFLYLSNAIDAEVVPDTTADGLVTVQILPTQILASSFDVYAQTAAGMAIAPTGQQIFRVRYAVNPANGKRELPITATIMGGSTPRLSATLDLYLDEPALAPVVNAVVANIPVAHNLYSYPLSLSVSGPVTFLPDGRMLVSLVNDNDVTFVVSLSAVSPLLPSSGTITLTIPKGTMRLEGVSQPIKQ